MRGEEHQQPDGSTWLEYWWRRLRQTSPDLLLIDLPTDCISMKSPWLGPEPRVSSSSSSIVKCYEQSVAVPTVFWRRTNPHDSFSTYESGNKSWPYPSKHYLWCSEINKMQRNQKWLGLPHDIWISKCFHTHWLKKKISSKVITSCY